MEKQGEQFLYQEPERRDPLPLAAFRQAWRLVQCFTKSLLQQDLLVKCSHEMGPRGVPVLFHGGPV